MSRCKASILVLILCSLSMVLSPAIHSQESSKPAETTPASAKAEAKEAPTAESGDALRKAAQNPVASLISVPVQENFNFNISPFDRTQNVLNIQPVIPARISTNWNLITRVITPIVYQPIPPTEGQVTPQGVYGLGDLNPTFFLSPAKPGKVIWGVGPAIVLPTATSIYLGQGKWSMGPSVVLLTQPGHWTLGLLTNNVWSFAGHSDRQDVNQFLLQYFINYNLKKGYYLTWQPTITANWEANSPYRWTVPYGGGIGRITKIGFQPVNLTLQFYGNPVRPPGTSPWGMRMQIAFLFPKLTKAQEKMMMEQKLKQMDQQQPEKK